MEERPSRMDAGARRTWLLDLIAALDPGVTRTVEYPTGALAELRDLASAAPEVDWYPVELRDDETVIELVRRTGEPADRTAVIAFMRADHRQVQRLLARLRELVARASREEAVATLRGLSAALRRHFGMEEELLLPIIARRLISPRGPAAVLRDEHLRIVEHLLHVESDLDRGDLAGAARELVDFEVFVARHAMLEDQVLYAITDGLLTEAERAAVVAECRRVELEPA